jgi:hypothetical protein
MNRLKATVVFACFLIASITPAFAQFYTYTQRVNSTSIVQGIVNTCNSISLVYFDMGPAPGVYTQTVQVAPRQTHLWTGLQPNTQYFFRARIFDSLAGWQVTSERTMSTNLTRPTCPGSIGWVSR